MGTKYFVKGGCVVCLMCIYECPIGAISIKTDETVVIDQDKCVGCGSCYRNCQTGAITKVEDKGND